MGSTSDGWQQACTTGKMSTTSSPRLTTELVCEFCSRINCYSPSNKSPQSSDRQELVRQSPRWFGPKFGPPVRHCGFRRWGAKNWPKRLPPSHPGRRGGSLLPSPLLADSNGHFNRIWLQPTGRKRRRSGAWPILPPASLLRWLPYLAGSQPCGLQHFDNFWGQGLC